MIHSEDWWRAVHNMSEINMLVFFFVWKMTFIMQMCYWLFTNSSVWACNTLQLYVMYIVASILIHCNYFFYSKSLLLWKKVTEDYTMYVSSFPLPFAKGIRRAHWWPFIFTMQTPDFHNHIWMVLRAKPFSWVRYPLHHQLLIERIL